MKASIATGTGKAMALCSSLLAFNTKGNLSTAVVREKVHCCTQVAPAMRASSRTKCLMAAESCLLQTVAVAKGNSPKVECTVAASFSSRMATCAHHSPCTCCVRSNDAYALRYLGYYADGRRINPPGVKSFAEVRDLESMLFFGIVELVASAFVQLRQSL